MKYITFVIAAALALAAFHFLHRGTYHDDVFTPGVCETCYGSGYEDPPPGGYELYDVGYDY